MKRSTQMLAVASGVFLELVRRKDFTVLGILAGLFLAFLAAARFVGFDHAAAGTFLLNLSLTLIVGLAHVIALVTAARQLPDEMERGTIYPLLARPIRRSDVLLGKWTAATAAGMVVFYLLGGAALGLIPKLEPYEAGTLAQLLALQAPALAVTAAAGMLFPLWLARAPGLFIAAAIVFGAGPLARVGGGLWPALILPDPGRLNLVLRYTDGIAPIPGIHFLLLLLYGVLWSLLLLTAAAYSFQRRSL